MATNKKILFKGVRFLSGALPLLFIGPIVINSAFKNKQHTLYPYVLGIGIIACILAVYLIFKGINTVVKSMFDGNK